MMIVGRMHRQGGEALLAACDDGLVGTTLKGDGIKASLSDTFFGDEELTRDEFRILLTQATTANLFGSETVSLAIELGFVDEACVIYFGEVPHAQLFVL